MQPINHSEAIAASAAIAAWAGACASTLASVVALGVAVWSARREESRRLRVSRDQEITFCFGMVGALERLKPMIIDVQASPSGGIARRDFRGVVEHTRRITEAALAIQVFDMQMLRDAYSLQGVLGMLCSLLEEYATGPVPREDVWAIIEPRLGDLLEADDRFFARLPSIEDVRGIHGRTPVAQSL